MTPVDKIAYSVTGLTLLMLAAAVIVGLVSMWPVLQELAGG
jgi:hypothetical protein